MIKNKLTLEQSSHQYSLIPISVTRLVNNYLEKEIADSTRNSTHFKKAVHFGNQFHEIAENIINLKKLNKFNIDLFLNELQHQNYDENLLNVTKTFIT